MNLNTICALCLAADVKLLLLHVCRSLLKIFTLQSCISVSFVDSFLQWQLAFLFYFLLKNHVFIRRVMKN